MEFTGKNVKEAVETGLKEMGLTEETAVVTVIEEEVKGLFGKVKKPAKVEITAKTEENVAEKVSDGKDAQNAVEFLQELFAKLNINAKATLVSDGEQIVIDVIAEDSAAVIGYRGEVLDSLQTLAGAVANIGEKDYRRVVVNCEGYREKREETLISLAHKLADKAVRLGRDVTLEPMNPYERRIIHSALSDSDKVTTTSEGKEPNRYVIIVPNEKKPQARRNGGNGKGYGHDRKGGRNYGSRKGGSGFTEKPMRKSPSGFGTFLGNSLKDE